MKNRLEYNESGAKNEMQRQSGFRQGPLKGQDHFGKKKTKSGRRAVLQQSNGLMILKIARTGVNDHNHCK